MPTGAANQRFRKERIKAAGGTHTKMEVAAIRLAQGDRCVYCNISLEGRGHVDHIVPISSGGCNCKFNLQILCISCNCIKGTRVLGELFEPIHHKKGDMFHLVWKGYRPEDWPKIYRSRFVSDVKSKRPLPTMWK